MLSTTRSRGLDRAIAAVSAPSVLLPKFLLPAFKGPSRSFAVFSQCQSQIGRSPLSIPPGVTFTITQPDPQKTARLHKHANGPVVDIVGPLGKMSMAVPSFVVVQYDEATRKAGVIVQDREIKEQREMWGTTRAYLQNHIMGVSEGHTSILRLVGVGYRATVENTATTKLPEFEGQQFVVLKVGYSHPIELPVPKGVKASVPQPTRILLEGVDKLALSMFAADIRQWRRPEPYKGKGIFVNGETIKLKAKKIK